MKLLQAALKGGCRHRCGRARAAHRTRRPTGGASPSSPDADGMTPLHYAAWCAEPHRGVFPGALIRHSPGTEIPSVSWRSSAPAPIWTPLTTTVRRAGSGAGGAGPTGVAGSTALHAAAFNGQLGCVVVLVRCCARAGAGRCPCPARCRPRRGRGWAARTTSPRAPSRWRWRRSITTSPRSFASSIGIRSSRGRWRRHALRSPMPRRCGDAALLHRPDCG